MSSNEESSENSTMVDEQKAIEDSFSIFNAFIDNLNKKGTSHLSKSAQEQLKLLKSKMSLINTNDPGPSGSGVLDAIPVKEKETINNKSKIKTDEEKGNNSSDNETEYYDDSNDETKPKAKTLFKRKVRDSLSSSSSKSLGFNTNDGGYQKMIDALNKLDVRKSPKLEKFDEDGSLELNKYFIKFEQYCKDNLKSNRMYWVAELEEHLSKETLKAFQVLKDEEDGYDEIRDKMLSWYKDMDEIRKEKNKKKFKDAEMRDDESLFLFSSRLEKLYKAAYPTHDIKGSKKLLDKFLESIPTTCKRQFSDVVFSYKVKNEKIKWNTIQKLARVKDVDMSKNNSKTENKEPIKNIIINTGQSVSTGPSDNTVKNINAIQTVDTKPQKPNNNYNRFPNNSQYRTPNNYGQNMNFNSYNNGNPFVNYQAQRPYFDGYGSQSYNPRNFRPRMIYNSNIIPFRWNNFSHLVDQGVMNDRKCYTCGKPGHIARYCPDNQRTPQQNNEAQINNDSSPQTSQGMTSSSNLNTNALDSRDEARSNPNQ